MIKKAGQNKIITFIKNNWPLLIILLIGAFLRLYRIGEYMTFLGDEGRDAIIVRRLLVYGDPILIGPGTSVGSMYLGPLYYYFMAPFLFLSNFSPIGPAIGGTLLGVATIYLVYLSGKNWFSKKVGLISAVLFATAPVVIIYSRSSWNPNIMPFFALLSIYSIWKVFKEKKYKWLLITAVSFAFVMQSHYLGLLLAPVLIVFWLLAKVPLKYTFFSLALFLFLMSPLLIFDIRHNYINTNALYKFFTVRQETISIRPWNAIPKSYPIFEQINTSLLSANNLLVGKYITIAITLFIIWVFAFKKKNILGPNYYLLILWLAFSLIGFGLYKQHIYDHYFGFLFPVSFILTALLLQEILKSKLKYIGTIALLFLVFNNLSKSPIRSSPNKQMQRAEMVAEKIKIESNGEPLNLAVLAERNYEDGYQYFLEKDNVKVVEIDAQIEESVVDQLFVACELSLEKCDPTHSPKTEVANFGWSKIENQWEVDGVFVFKLIHSQ